MKPPLPGFDGVVGGLRGSLLSRTLAQAPFVGLLSAYAISQFSEGMTQTALTWIAFRIRHGDVSLVGRIGLIQTIVPFLVLIPAGLLIDLLPRQILLAALNLFKGATYALVPLLSLFAPIGTLPLIAIVVATAVLSAGVGPAFNASVPEFVPRDRLEHANGWIQIAGQGGYLLGPLATAGLLLLFRPRGCSFSPGRALRFRPSCLPSSCPPFPFPRERRAKRRAGGFPIRSRGCKGPPFSSFGPPF